MATPLSRVTRIRLLHEPSGSRTSTEPSDRIDSSAGTLRPAGRVILDWKAGICRVAVWVPVPPEVSSMATPPALAETCQSSAVRLTT